jgi:hypothetical protein
MHSRKKMIITVKTVVATAALLAALVPGAGVAHADTVKCHVGGGGELWCEDWETGQSWEQEPGGSYPYPPCNWANPYCNGG